MKNMKQRIQVYILIKENLIGLRVIDMNLPRKTGQTYLFLYLP